MLKKIALRLAATAVAMLVTATYASEARNFNIPPGDLAPALESLAKETGLELIFQPDELKGMRTQGVSGTLSPQEAVAKLINGTRLTIRTDSAGAILIAAPIAASAATGQATNLRLAQTTENQSSQKSDSSADESESSSSGKLEEIVVTAQKRLERLQDVPIAISVLSGESLDAAPVPSVLDAIQRVPGVAAITSSTGARFGGVANVTIRGVPPTAGSSTVAYYLDSAPFGLNAGALAGGTFSPDASAYDLERVEVLRGPQGTLYGASAVNGVVRILTHDADLDAFEFKMRSSASSTAHGSESYRGDAAVNLPIIDGKLAVRLVGGYQDIGGWIDRSITSDPLTTPAPLIGLRSEKDANDGVQKNARIKVNAAPTENLTLGASIWLSRLNTDAQNVSADGRTHPSIYLEPSSIDYDVYTGAVGYDFGPVVLSSSTSYLDFQLANILDYQGLGLANTLLDSRQNSSVVSHEMVLNSAGEGPWRWTVGGLYRNGEDKIYQLRPGYLAVNQWRTESEAIAAFGEVTRKFFAGQLELTGGLRYYDEEIRLREDSFFLVAGGIPAGGLARANPSFSEVTPRAVLTWHPRSETTVYASYGQGFRSGILQSPTVTRTAPQYPAAQPDKLHTYELGVKSSTLNERVFVDAALFYLDWKDVQQSLLVQATPTFLTSAYVNAPSASGLGFEVSASIEPVDNLRISVNYAYSGLEVDRDTVSIRLAPLAPMVLFPKGSRLIYSPEHTGGASIEYSLPLGGGGLTGRATLSGHYLPKMVSAVDTPITSNVGVPLYSDSLIMARASLSVEGPKRWTASVFAENITDENGVTGRDPFGGGRWYGRIRPRTIGVQLEFKY